MTEWRFDLHKMWPAFSTTTVGDVWPDVRKTVIYRELLDWGIDAASLLVEITNEPGMSTGFPGATYVKDATIEVGKKTMEIYGSEEATYIGLVHELAHVLQGLTGSLTEYYDETRLWLRYKSWEAIPQEQEAIRWSGRQARRMGWSETDTRRVLNFRYHERRYRRDVIAREALTGFGMHPRQEPLPLYRRPPVRVRVHRRYRQRYNRR